MVSKLLYQTTLAGYPKDMDKTFTKAFVPIREEIKELRDVALHKTEMLKLEISAVAIPRILRQLRVDIIVNLVDYGATSSNPRHKTIEEAFWILDDIIGFDWNPKGSFTWDGATRQMNKDLTLRRHKFRIDVEIEGRLEDLENGDVDWSALRSFFFSYKTYAKLSILYPNSVDRIYDDLRTLFSKTKDPTEQGGRPYISQAVNKSKGYMHEAILDSVINVFGTDSEKGWYRNK